MCLQGNSFGALKSVTLHSWWISISGEPDPAHHPAPRSPEPSPALPPCGRAEGSSYFSYPFPGRCWGSGYTFAPAVAHTAQPLPSTITLDLPQDCGNRCFVPRAALFPLPHPVCSRYWNFSHTIQHARQQLTTCCDALVWSGRCHRPGLISVISLSCLCTCLPHALQWGGQ